MFNAADLLGTIMQSGGMARSTNQRIEHSLGERGVGGAEGLLGQILGGGRAPMQPGGGGSQGGMLGMLASMAGSMLKGGGSGGSAGGGSLLGNLAGALSGGGQTQQTRGAPGGGGQTQPARGALGGGMIAILGSLAMQAFKKTGAQGGGGTDNVDELLAGLRKPESAEEEQEIQDMALLTLKAMINAAKADGEIDEQEAQKILGKVQENGVTEEERQFLQEEMRKPVDIDVLVRSVPNQQAAAQIYAASLFAIEVDTDAERRYLDELARRLRLDPNVVSYIQSSVGI